MISIYPSQMGAMLGVNKYKSRLSMLKECSARVTSHISTHPCKKRRIERGCHNALVAGIEYESSTINLFEKSQGVNVYPVQQLSYVQNSEWKLVGKCDGITSDGALVEVKCRMNHIRNTIPDSDYVQVQAYLTMYNMNRCYYVQRLVGTDELTVNVVLKDSGYWDGYVIPEVDAFVKIVLSGTVQQV